MDQWLQLLKTGREAQGLCLSCVLWFCLLQAKSFSLVLDVLTRFKAADVQKAVETLSSEELDVLVKYIYRGFAEPTENSCGILLTWHEKVWLCANDGCSGS